MQGYFEKVKKHFGGDLERTWAWFEAPNPRFDYQSPLIMIAQRKGERVKRYIDEAIRDSKELK
jgi:hypothetical protein